MHGPTMAALEFPRIQQELAAHAACKLGKELALAVEPLPSPDLVRRVQQETTEAKGLLSGGRSLPFGGIHDVRLYVERALNGGVLRPDELLNVADTIYGCRQLHRFLTEHRAIAPLLSRYAEAFGRFGELEAEINRCIERGMVSSRASRSLKQTRNEIATLETRIQERLNGLLKHYRLYLQDVLVTSRNGRYVIPVKASAKASVPGTVHGSSASGSTLFVEPEAVSSLCEELETWRAMEQAEVEQVLMALSGQVADQAESLQATLGAVAELDLIAARARLSMAWNASPVAWSDAGEVNLKGARHPLLGRNAVANLIRLSANARMLIVTGPNTGGKTLLLKTLGLLVILARCGLHIPVDEGSTLCFFEDVLADIGDHQSLEQSLSTFSGHIANIVPMLEKASPRTLILLDELGSGTDPHEGTGLGIALLEAFLERGAYTLVTTHLRDIKEFGRTTPGCAFAGMGFDGESLRPTYRLLYGALGESRGLEIAARAGLPAAVVQRARALVHGGSPAGTASVDHPAPPAHPAPRATPSEPAEWPVSPSVPVLPAPVARTQRSPWVLAALSPRRVRVWTGEGEREMGLSDPLRRLHPAGLVVGDRLQLREGALVGLSNRQNTLVSRDADTMVESVVAANLDRLLILLSARQPDFATPVLARHLLYAERQGVTPIICLTKADLVSPATVEGWLRPLRRAGYETVAVSAAKGQGLGLGLEELRRLLTGHLTGVLSLSGAGKSHLLARLGVEEQPLRATPLDSESWLVDLPSLRELGVWKPDLTSGLAGFGPFASRCNRPGCLHGEEPGCAVREAVAEGHLERTRYDLYRWLIAQFGLS